MKKIMNLARYNGFSANKRDNVVFISSNEETVDGKTLPFEAKITVYDGSYGYKGTTYTSATEVVSKLIREVSGMLEKAEAPNLSSAEMRDAIYYQEYGCMPSEW